MLLINYVLVHDPEPIGPQVGNQAQEGTTEHEGSTDGRDFGGDRCTAHGVEWYRFRRCTSKSMGIAEHRPQDDGPVAGNPRPVLFWPLIACSVDGSGRIQHAHAA